MTVSLSAYGLVVDGRHVPVYAGTIHYWRLERALWPTILDQAQRLGFNMIETYIPWSVHETSPGHYDWGQEDERKDIEAFMQLCEERGLWLMVRPGPLINAELTGFGFPHWVLLNPCIQARTSVGSLHLDAAWGLHPPHQFPVPSYASEAFYEAVGCWFDAVCPFISRHLAPSGCIVSVQSDNETCYLFHDRAYATDYSEASIRLYQQFLQGKHETLEKLNALYRTDYQSFSEIEPPRDCTIQQRSDMPWHREWVEYKEYQIRWSIARIAVMLHERGVRHVPIFHDVAFQYRTPLDLSLMEETPEIDWVGMNLYRNKESYRGTIQQMRFLAGTTRLPFVPEFGSGLWSHHPRTPNAAEQTFITLSSFMYGMKAVTFYMLVERERWQGSPITRHGTLRENYAELYQKLLAFLTRYQFWRFERQPRALVMMNYDLERYSALASTLHYAHTDLYGLPSELFKVDLDLDFQWDVAAEADERSWKNWFGTTISALEERFIDYDLADSHLTRERLRRYPLVCLPTVDFMDSRDQQRLIEYVQAGGQLLIGPGLPYLTPDLQPCELLSCYVKTPGITQVGKGLIIWSGRDEIDASLALLLSPADFVCDQPLVDINLHRYANDTMLFAANPKAFPLSAQVCFEQPRAFHSAWDELPTQQGTTLTLALAPYSIQIWEVRND